MREKEGKNVNQMPRKGVGQKGKSQNEQLEKKKKKIKK